MGRRQQADGRCRQIDECPVLGARLVGIERSRHGREEEVCRMPRVGGVERGVQGLKYAAQYMPFDRIPTCFDQIVYEILYIKIVRRQSRFVTVLGLDK